MKIQIQLRLYISHKSFTENYMEINSFANKHLNIFPGSIQQCSVMKMLPANCLRESFGYLRQNSFGINRLFVDLANENEKNTYILTGHFINHLQGKRNDKKTYIKK